MKYSKPYNTCGQALMRVPKESGRSSLSLIYKTISLLSTKNRE